MKDKVINGYTLQHLLGEGGMAEVWYAENSIGKPAAIKILKKELSLMQEVDIRFANEAKVMVKLNHNNIRQVYDYGNIDGRPCIIMEYLEGADLSVRLKRGENFSQLQLQKWWDELASALNYTHAREVIHRDIKPSNIFITDDDHLKLLDFGIAKIRSSITLTQTGAHMGTLLYMSPEQVKDSKHLDFRTDLYSLAVTFYHLQTGFPPYDSTNSSAFEIQTQIVNEPLHLALLPLQWSSFLFGYLEKEPGKRPILQPFSNTKSPTDSGSFEPDSEKKTKLPSASQKIDETLIYPVNFDTQPKADPVIPSVITYSWWWVPIVILIPLLIAIAWPQGPSDRELLDSAIRDSIRMADSIAMIEAEQARLADSIAAVMYENEINAGN